MSPMDARPVRSTPGRLPARARLLHIGLMKTGTTAVQRAASGRRKALLRNGVRYPGPHYNHRQAALALMNRDGDGSKLAEDDDAWTTLLQEVNDDQTRRIWISNEFICGSDERTAQRFLDDLGPRTHVVITVRSVGAALPSLWQQYVKTGWTQDFPSFLATVLAAPFDIALLPPNYQRNDQGAVVSRWAAMIGSENVTVVIVDKADPRRVQVAFETMLGLPAGTLETPKASGYAENRSLSAEEVSLFLQVNQALPHGQVSQDEIVRILQNGAMARVLDQRSPEHDHRISLPPWARTLAGDLGSRYADAIASSGVTVVGDLAELSQIPAQEGRWDTSPLIPVELAAEAVIGAMSAGLQRGSQFGKPRPLADRAARPTSARRVLTAAVRRARIALALR